MVMRNRACGFERGSFIVVHADILFDAFEPNCPAGALRNQVVNVRFLWSVYQVFQILFSLLRGLNDLSGRFVEGFPGCLKAILFKFFALGNQLFEQFFCPACALSRLLAGLVQGRLIQPARFHVWSRPAGYRSLGLKAT